MHLPDSDDRLNARIAAERHITGEPLDAARGIAWSVAIALALAVIVAGAVLAFGHGVK